MHPIPETFKAFRIHDDEDGYRSGVDAVSIDELSEGEVTIQVAWSGINYKDALAATGKGKILRKYPLCGGIDVAGTVVESSSDEFQAGDEVLANGSGLSEVRDGGYSEYLRLPADIVVRLPSGLTAREAMGLGTAGFTAAMSLYRMEANGQRPEMGPIVVTGASGGVGTVAIDLLTAAGYEVHAITGKVDEFDWLEHLGARQCISRHELYWGQKPLEKNLLGRLHRQCGRGDAGRYKPRDRPVGQHRLLRNGRRTRPPDDRFSDDPARGQSARDQFSEVPDRNETRALEPPR